MKAHGKSLVTIMIICYFHVTCEIGVGMFFEEHGRESVDFSIMRDEIILIEISRFGDRVERLWDYRLSHFLK